MTKTVQAASGDVVVAGLFSGTTNFARSTQKAAVLTARGDTDIFVADYAADGTLRWAVRIGGDYTDGDLEKYKDRDLEISQNRFSRFVGKIGSQPRNAGEYANDIAVDAGGNVYLAGTFRETLRAGGFKLTASDEYTDDYYDALAVKISSTGDVSWAKQFGGAFDDDALSVGLDRAGNPYFGGYFSRTAQFGNGLELQTDGRDGGYVQKLNPDGRTVYAYSFQSDSVGTDERNSVNDIAVTPSGNVYFAGTISGTAKFNALRGGFELDAEGKTDAVLGYLNRKGVFGWAESSGGDDYDGNTAIALDAAGDVYTAGYFTGEDIDGNPLPGVETDFTATPEDNDNNPDFSDILVSKFSSTGKPVWIDQIGGGYIEVIADLTIAPTGGVYTTGSFFRTFDADPGKADFELRSRLSNDGSIKDKNTDFGRNETYDWFVDEISPRGHFVGAARIGGQDDDFAGGLTNLAGGGFLVYGRLTPAVGDDRDDRNEQSYIDYLSGF